MKRGEIWTAAAGAGYGAKPRPAAIIQADEFEHTNSVTLCLLTTDASEVPLVRVEVEPSSTNGLETVSRLMVDKIITIPRTRLGRRVGNLDRGDLVRLNQALLLFLGLATPVTAEPDAESD